MATIWMGPGSKPQRHTGLCPKCQVPLDSHVDLGKHLDRLRGGTARCKLISVSDPLPEWETDEAQPF